jgi:hypothetical protein
MKQIFRFLKDGAIMKKTLVFLFCLLAVSRMAIGSGNIEMSDGKLKILSADAVTSLDIYRETDDAYINWATGTLYLDGGSISFDSNSRGNSKFYWDDVNNTLIVYIIDANYFDVNDVNANTGTFTGAVTIDTLNLTNDLALAHGGTGASLSDPGADRILIWDDSAATVGWATWGTGLVIDATPKIYVDHDAAQWFNSDEHIDLVDGTANIDTSGSATFGQLIVDNIAINSNTITLTDQSTFDCSAELIHKAASSIRFYASGDDNDFAYFWTNTNVPELSTSGTCELKLSNSLGTPRSVTVSEMEDAHNHISNNGSDHSYIDQDLQTSASPTFNDLTVSTPSNIYALDHNSFANFHADEHIDWTDADVNLSVGPAVVEANMVELNKSFYHKDDEDTIFTFFNGGYYFTGNNTEIMRMAGPIGHDAAYVVCNNALAVMDWYWKGDNDAELLYLDADVDRVGISTSTPQALFDVAGDTLISGHIGLGGASVDADYGLNYSETLTDTDNSAKLALYFKTDVTKTTAPMTSVASGVYGAVSLDSTNTQNWSYSPTGLICVYGSLNTEASSAGTVTGGACFLSYASIADAATVTNLYGYYHWTPTVAGAKLVNNFGIYLADQDGVGSGNNYAIYTAGAASDSYLEGSISALDVTDRTPAWLGTPAEALTAVLDIDNVGGKIDHNSLPDFCKRTAQEMRGTGKYFQAEEGEVEIREPITVPARSLGATVTLLVESTKALQQEVDELRARLSELEGTK